MLLETGPVHGDEQWWVDFRNAGINEFINRLKGVESDAEMVPYNPVAKNLKMLDKVPSSRVVNFRDLRDSPKAKRV